MSRLEKASDEIIEFITNIIEEHELDAFAQFRFFELPKQKEVIKVSKASATAAMDCSTPGFPFLHYLPELAQSHVH